MSVQLFQTLQSEVQYEGSMDATEVVGNENVLSKCSHTRPASMLPGCTLRRFKPRMPALSTTFAQNSEATLVFVDLQPKWYNSLKGSIHRVTLVFVDLQPKWYNSLTGLLHRVTQVFVDLQPKWYNSLKGSIHRVTLVFVDLQPKWYNSLTGLLHRVTQVFVDLQPKWYNNLTVL
jgi:hypothetical protein